MPSVRTQARRRQQRRANYVERRETETEFFARVKRAIRRTARRAGHEMVQHVSWAELDEALQRITPANRHPPLLDDWEPPRLNLHIQPASLD